MAFHRVCWSIASANFLLIAAVILTIALPQVAKAQDEDYQPVDFVQPLDLSRGSLSPVWPYSFYLSHEESCAYVEKEFGWDPAECPYLEHIIFYPSADIDTLIVDKPVSDGYIELDDWASADHDEEIETIWTELVEGAKIQSKRVGKEIRPIRWVIYPTVNEQKNILYYAYLLEWDGEPTVNMRATVFDRNGYVAFTLTPAATELLEVNLTKMAEATLGAYQPKPSLSYADFQEGDKVAAAGAVGVLAALLGVKYGREIAGGLLATILILAKKFWFVLLVPLAYFGRLLFRK